MTAGHRAAERAAADEAEFWAAVASGDVVHVCCECARWWIARVDRQARRHCDQCGTEMEPDGEGMT